MSLKFASDETEGKDLKVLCSSCKNITKHKVLTSVTEHGSEMWDEYDGIYWDTDYEIIQCQGCETISFRSHSINSEHDDHEGRPIPSILVYPNRSKNTIALKNFMNVPYNLQRIYRETVDSFNAGSLTLCGAGVRALVEGICQENGITDGNITYVKKDGTQTTKKSMNLQGKINGLHESGKLTSHYADILHEHRFLGNDAIHELSTPNKEDLELAIEIIENVFDTLYEVPSKGQRLKNKRLKK